MNALEQIFLWNFEHIETKHKKDKDIGFFFKKLNGHEAERKMLFEIRAYHLADKAKCCGYFEFYQSEKTSRKLKEINPDLSEKEMVFSSINVYEKYRENGLSKLLVKNGLAKLKNSGHVHVVRFYEENSIHAMAHQFAKINYQQINDEVLALYKMY